MGYAEVAAMKERLLSTPVTALERVVLLDMATAVADGSTVYTWGHDRLALAIDKEPRSVAAKRALSGRVFPSLIRKGLVRQTASAHRARRAEYDLVVLHGMGTGQPVDNSGMGTGLDPEWVPVLDVMGTAQTGTPPPISPPTPAPGAVPIHKHEPNARSALGRIVDGRRLPFTVDELLRAAYALGNGDPWDGYLVVKEATETAIGDARDPRAVILHRLHQHGLPADTIPRRAA